jgi:hypothetical protein
VLPGQWQREKQLRRILDVGVQTALDKVRWDQDAFRERAVGGACTIGARMFWGVVRTMVVGQRTGRSWSGRQLVKYYSVSLRGVLTLMYAAQFRPCNIISLCGPFTPAESSFIDTATWPVARRGE